MMTLPIDQHLEPIKKSLEAHNRLILVAQPGAGKTTRVPLALLASDWAAGQKIILLEPRRVAARLAASYMAAQLSEPVGRTIGYRMRGETCVSESTRLEVVTQGVWTRMLQDDPLLEGIGGVIFDEFHERSLEADLGLALTLDVQQSIRDDLRLVVMSATLDVAALKRVLGENTPLIESSGKQHPVHTHYRPPCKEESIEAAAARVADEVVAQDATRDLLIILPGVREITRLVKLLETTHPDRQVMPLHGRMAIAEQRAALVANPQRQRIVVSTAITESSVTVDGVCVVIDAGQERVPIFNPRTGLTRLTTRRVNRASADQRRGRAGRQQEGNCYRLWSQEQPLVAHGEPEIAQADLSRLALELAHWGAASPSELAWLTQPPEGAWQRARGLLQALGVLDASARLTPLGTSCGKWPVEPRLAVMLSRAERLGVQPLACDLAAMLEGQERIDDALSQALHQRRQTPERFPQWRADRRRLMELAGCKKLNAPFDEAALGALAALAYPDRVAQCLMPGRFKLANGKTAVLRQTHPLAQEPFIVVISADSATSDATIYLAQALDESLLTRLYPAALDWHERVTWSTEKGRLFAEQVQQFGELRLASRPLHDVPPEKVSAALVEALRQRPEKLFDEAVHSLQGRMALLRRHAPGQWPDWSDNRIVETLETWLMPYLAGVTRLAEIAKLPLASYLLASLDWSQQQRFERLAPTRLSVPSGGVKAIDYLPCRDGNPPVLALKLQEAFGWQETPTVVDGLEALTIHLLSPAKRPLQVTQDLRSFWLNGYPEVRKEMRGRYPKHPWPEDPLTALPTAFTKQRQEKG